MTKKGKIIVFSLFLLIIIIVVVGYFCLRNVEVEDTVGKEHYPINIIM